MSILNMLIAHSSDILRALVEIVGGVSILIGLLPASSSKNAIIALLGRVSVLTHSDSPGTLKAPGALMPLPMSMRLIKKAKK